MKSRQNQSFRTIQRLSAQLLRRIVVTLNNFVLALILRQGYFSVLEARRRSAARHLHSLKLTFEKT